ncbi:unnamed protein product [Urochloa decumbens]|uniref:F-box domain-containing protein n=1 Tax=Urochloa decumbens TaxID=240449 RepID=A0ABC8YB15_9POAL
MPPPALPDDLVDQVLLRFPPEEPELLVCVALVCKRWFRLISDPHFRRRFRELHRAAPMLGFFCTDYHFSRFVPTFSAPLPHAIPGDWRAVDARHGRVLFNTVACWDDFTFFVSGEDLVVWYPVTGEQHRLPNLSEHMYPHQFPFHCHWTAAVLCASAEGGCDHLDCGRGPFLVVFVCTSSTEAFVSVYSSETGAWSGPASAQLRRAGVHLAKPSALVGKALHFISGDCGTTKILKYVLGTQEISLIHLPKKPYRHIALMTMADGGLGFAAVHGFKLDLWSGVSGTKGYAKWAQSQAIDLETIGTLSVSFETVCCIDGVAAILMGNDKTCVIINLKSGQIRKITEGRIAYPVVPYTSFYTPALGAATTCEGPREGSSSA